MLQTLIAVVDNVDAEALSLKGAGQKRADSSLILNDQYSHRLTPGTIVIRGMTCR